MLNNTIYRLKKEKSLRIGYFGGSVTEGAGATVWDETSWRGRINRYMKEMYPDAKITEIQAAIGGTGTDFGHCRCKHDLLSKNPQLVFIEFAVNDSDMSFQDQMMYYESCLRQILMYDDTIDIICVFTATKRTETMICQTGDHSARSIQATLAHYYSLPTVDLGDHMRRAVAFAGGDWLRYTTDETHPNDEGYIIYTEAMKQALSKMLSGDIPEKLTNKSVPSPLSPYPFTNGRMIELCECEHTMNGFTFTDKPFKKRFPYYYKANGVGSTIDFDFEGTGFGIYQIMDDHSGTLEISLDGEKPILISAWDSYCKSFSRAGYAFPFRGLENKHHRVHIRVSDKKDPESLGNDIAIFAFLLL